MVKVLPLVHTFALLGPAELALAPLHADYNKSDVRSSVLYCCCILFHGTSNKDKGMPWWSAVISCVFIPKPLGDWTSSYPFEMCATPV